MVEAQKTLGTVSHSFGSAVTKKIDPDVDRALAVSLKLAGNNRGLEDPISLSQSGVNAEDLIQQNIRFKAQLEQLSKSHPNAIQKAQVIMKRDFDRLNVEGVHKGIIDLYSRGLQFLKDVVAKK